MSAILHRRLEPQAADRLRNRVNSTYAVRAARAGTPAEIISRQLGHANAVLVLKVYGRFTPSAQERDKWEQIAALQNAEMEKRREMGAIVGAIPATVST